MKSDEEIRKLLQASNYFKVESLQRLINMFLVQKYHIPLIDKDAKIKFEEYGIDTNNK